MFLGIVEGVFCKYKGENSYRYLEEFRLNMVSRLSWVIGGEGVGLEWGIKKREVKALRG